MSKRKPNQSPLSKGAALIIAREILGPDAHVFRAGNGAHHVGLIQYGGYKRTLATGETYEAALEFAKKDPQADAWTNYKENRRNAFLDAFNSLRDTARAILGNKNAKLERHELRFIQHSLGRLA